jgi:hypothetical protein
VGSLPPRVGLGNNYRSTLSLQRPAGLCKVGGVVVGAEDERRRYHRLSRALARRVLRRLEGLRRAQQRDRELVREREMMRTMSANG